MVKAGICGWQRGHMEGFDEAMKIGDEWRKKVIDEFKKSEEYQNLLNKAFRVYSSEQFNNGFEAGYKSRQKEEKRIVTYLKEHFIDELKDINIDEED